MTTANMKLIALSVTFPDKLEVNDAKLDDGEHIVKRIVELRKLKDELHGESWIWDSSQLGTGLITSLFFIHSLPEYARKVFAPIYIRRYHLTCHPTYRASS